MHLFFRLSYLMHTGFGHETRNTAVDTNVVEGKHQYKLECLAGVAILVKGQSVPDVYIKAFKWC